MRKLAAWDGLFRMAILGIKPIHDNEVQLPCARPLPGNVHPLLKGEAILAARHQTYLQAREGNTARWPGDTRDGSTIGVVTLNPNPERDAVSVTSRLKVKHGWLHELGDNYLDLLRNRPTTTVFPS